MNTEPFRCAFPLIKLPPERGGEDAIVILSVVQKQDLTVAFATAIDRKGRVHQSFPIPMTELQAAALAPAYFMQVPCLPGPSPIIGAPKLNGE